MMKWVRGVLYDVFGPGQTALLCNVLDGRQWSPDYLLCFRHHSLNSREHRRFCAFFTREVMSRDHDKLSVISNRELGATGYLHCGVTDEEWCVMVLFFSEFYNFSTLHLHCWVICILHCDLEYRGNGIFCGATGVVGKLERVKHAG